MHFIYDVLCESVYKSAERVVHMAADVVPVCNGCDRSNIINRSMCVSSCAGYDCNGVAIDVSVDVLRIGNSIFIDRNDPLFNAE